MAPIEVLTAAFAGAAGAAVAISGLLRNGKAQWILHGIRRGPQYALPIPTIPYISIAAMLCVHKPVKQQPGPRCRWLSSKRALSPS